MLSWVASWFRPSDRPKVEDIEAAYQPEVHNISNKTTTTVPIGSRTFKFALGIFSPSRGLSTWGLWWWKDFKNLFTRTSLTLTVAAPRTVTTSAPPPTAPSPRLPTPPPPSRASRSNSPQPEMFELGLTSSAGPIPLPPPQAKLTPLPPAKIDTTPTTISSTRKATYSPILTPPITPPSSLERCLPYDYTIPDFIAHFPYPLRVNKHYQPVAALSEQWLNDSGVHPSEKKRAAFEACNIGLLTAMAYPLADRERFRVLCDFDNALFAWDDLTDEGGLRKDGSGTKKAADIIMNSLHRPFAYETEFRCGKIFADLWGRAIQIGCSPGAQRRFLEHFDLYAQAVHTQVLNRAKNHIPDLDDWIKLRRDTGGLKLCFSIGEFGLNLNLPDEVFECPLIKVMEDCANDVVVLSNDIYSYNIEQAQGDPCNIIQVAMSSRNLSLQASMDLAGEQVKGRVDLYTATKARLPSWGPQVDQQVRLYLTVLEDWMSAGFNWSLESQRYFGRDVREVKRTLRVRLLPREAPRGQIIIPDLHLDQQVPAE